MESSGMADTKNILQIYPGRGLGWMNLGASIHAITSRIKSQPQLYPQLSLSYSLQEPTLNPLHLDLPKNDVRLRFDGPDQRLRLIEIIGWTQTTFTYKSAEVVRRSVQTDKTGESNAIAAETTIPGPSFRHIYNRLFGPAYAGEYIPPVAGQSLGTYVLSYPGLAIRFPLKHSAFSDKADFVSLLSSAALPATSIAIFSGASWPEARDTLYTKVPPLPRSIALASRNNESVPDEIEQVIIHGGGIVELRRRSLPPFLIVLSVTTPQDLVAELGPPDAIFRKSSSRISIHAGYEPNINQVMGDSQLSHANTTPQHQYANNPRNGGAEVASEADSHIQSDVEHSAATTDCFYNYFHHGFDILISRPTVRSPPFPSSNGTSRPILTVNSENKLVATKIFLHGNIPGSYSFNRHRRSRWVIPLPSSFTPSSSNAQAQAVPSFVPQDDSMSQQLRSKDRKKSLGKQQSTSSLGQIGSSDPDATTHQTSLNSEMRFAQISHSLSALWSSSSVSASEEQYTARGMVLNRGWSADQDSSPESSVELLGGTMTMDDSSLVSTPTTGRQATTKSRASTSIEKGGGNTQLFGFPGMLFEVLDDGGISCVSIY